jgi:DNA-binding transcriptional regulator YiaG
MTPAALKSLRASLGWSQHRLAEELGVQRNTVNRWEMGTNPIPSMAEKLLATITLHNPAA